MATRERSREIAQARLARSRELLSSADTVRRNIISQVIEIRGLLNELPEKLTHEGKDDPLLLASEVDDDLINRTLSGEAKITSDRAHR